ncbi:MAG: Ig-like domain-containing protein [candidate division WOR-3 bacterium]
MKRLVAILIVFFFFSALFCAKKMLPPSPDRFPPRLVEANTRSRVQVELVFDEDLDPARFNPESLTITGLKVRGISLGRQQNRVVVWTEPQRQDNYLIQGVVWDVAGNPGRFRTGFKGSVRIDTIAPEARVVTPAPETRGLYRSVRIIVRFSEPVDTTTGLNYLIVPKAVETLFTRSWDANWQEIKFLCRDSLAGPDFYFLLLPGVVDLENNRCRMPVWTCWTTDSVFEGVRVHGRTDFNTQPVRSGVVFFNQGSTRALAPVLSDGSWNLKLRSGVYSVFGVGDTDFDGQVDLISPEVEFNTKNESLLLFFVPESLSRSVNEYCR